MSDRLTIAIDGPVAAGKTTIGRLLAQRLGAVLFDTGVVYRAVALEALRRGIDPQDAAAVTDIAGKLDLEVAEQNGQTQVRLSGEGVTEALRTPEVDRALPAIAASPDVRRALLPVQRRIAGNGRIVAVGRDIGTVIAPGADLKIYLDAEPEVRACRRYEELRTRGIEISLEEVVRDLKARDHRDLTRDHAPLQVASDAVKIDATNLSASEVVELILSYISDLPKTCQSERLV